MKELSARGHGGGRGECGGDDGESDVAGWRRAGGGDGTRAGQRSGDGTGLQAPGGDTNDAGLGKEVFPITSVSTAVTVCALVPLEVTKVV